MRRLTVALVCVFAATLYGCASIVEGTTQTITVNLSPKEATCIVQREKQTIGQVTAANPSVKISKSTKDLIFKCNAAGHREQFVKIESSASGWGVASCFLVDLCITDYSTGALNKYPETLNISLTPLKNGQDAPQGS